MNPTFELTHKSALENLETFNQIKLQESVCNFADLAVSSNGTNEILMDKTRSNVGRFAATFFSFGLCQKYRDDNKTRALKIQSIINASVDLLKHQIIVDNELPASNSSNRMTVEQRKKVEVALRNYETVVFESRTFFHRIARFYYWVLGLNNTQLKERLNFSFNPNNKAYESINNAAKSITNQTLAVLTPPSSASSFSFCTQSATPQEVSRTESESKELTTLTPLQANYVQYVQMYNTSRENLIISKASCDSVSELAGNIARIQRAQSVVVKQHIGKCLQVWEEVDTALVRAAIPFNNSNLMADDSRIIQGYYLFLFNAQDPASIRRDSQAAMTKIVDESVHELMLLCLGFFSGDKDNTFNTIEKLLPLLLNSKSDPKMILNHLFEYFIQKINAKIEEQHCDKLNEPEQIVIEYQVQMMVLRCVGKAIAIKKSIWEGPLGNLLKQHGIDLSATPEETAFEMAFNKYAATIYAEQEVNRHLMAKLFMTPNLSQEDLEKEYLNEMNLQAEKARTSQQDALVTPQKESLTDILCRAPLDINDLGYDLKELEKIPVVQNASSTFLKMYLGSIGSFAMRIFFNMGRFAEVMERAEKASRQKALPSGSQRPSLIAPDTTSPVSNV